MLNKIQTTPPNIGGPTLKYPIWSYDEIKSLKAEDFKDILVGILRIIIVGYGLGLSHRSDNNVPGTQNRPRILVRIA